MKKLCLVLGLVALLTCSGFATGEDIAPATKNAPVKVTLPAANSRAPGSITTLFAQTQGATGNMFDITPTKDMEITAIDINASPTGSLALVEVFYYNGSCVGNETSPTGWTKFASNNATLAGIDLPTNVDLSGNGVIFKKGQTYGIYVHLESYPNGDRLWYTAGGPTTYSNADVTLVSHVGKQYPAFTGYTYFYRIWNGTLYYDTKDTYLTVNPDIIAESTGGVVIFTLDAGPANANRDYLLFAGVTGTSPGFTPPPGLVTIPINWDIFTNLVISLTNTTIFQNFYGFLDANGVATATFDTLGPFTGGAGLTMYFAYGLDLSYWDFASNAVTVSVVP